MKQQVGLWFGILFAVGLAFGVGRHLPARAAEPSPPKGWWCEKGHWSCFPDGSKIPQESAVYLTRVWCAAGRCYGEREDCTLATKEDCSELPN